MLFQVDSQTKREFCIKTEVCTEFVIWDTSTRT